MGEEGRVEREEKLPFVSDAVSDPVSTPICLSPPLQQLDGGTHFELLARSVGHA